jgi:L-lactate dehydrogenase complex protein LldF
MSTQTTAPGGPLPGFKARVKAAVSDTRLMSVVDRGTRRQDNGRREMLKELGDALGVRSLAARIKDHTLQNLDRYLEQLCENVRKHGGHVHFAADAEQACQIITEIGRAAGTNRIVKSKSMASEEVQLDPALIKAGFEVVETDLGEYILQIAGEHPFHIVVPVFQKTREDIGRLFAEKLGIPYTDDPEKLTATARRVLREKFKTADMGIIGANFGVAETGTVCIVTNEGNGRLCSSRPRVLVSLMGIEKVIPRMRDLPVFLKLLAKSATGQRITCYTSLISGSRRPGDFDGPEEFHLVLLDRGRSKVLAGPYRETLRCIRCGACLNACPVYRKIGGHAYGGVYPGPIGKLITPLLDTLEAHEHLPQASSLCGACSEACPVRIDFPQHLIRMRGELRERGRMPWYYTVGFKFWKLGMKSAVLYRVGSKLAHWCVDLFAKDGWHRSLPGPVAEWTDQRDFPAMAGRSFRSQWDKLKDE